MLSTSFKIGDNVKKNPAKWILNDFDSWGRGEGVGVVVKPPFDLAENQVDVRWPAGKCFEYVDQILPASSVLTGRIIRY